MADIIQPNQVNPKSKQGTGFTNVQRILDANKQNRLASTIGGNISGQAQQNKQQTQQAGTQFNEQATKSNVATDANKQISQNVLSRIGSGNLLNEQEMGDAEQKFGVFRGGYKGPLNLGAVANVNQLRGTAQEAENLGQQTTSSGGRQNLLSRYVGGNQGYNQGLKSFDSTLLNQDKSNQLAQARRQTIGLDAKVGAAEQQASALGGHYADTGEQFRKEVVGGISGIENPLNQYINTRMQTAKQQEDARANAWANIDAQVKGGDVLGAINAAAQSGLIDPNQISTLRGNYNLVSGFKKMGTSGIDQKITDSENNARNYWDQLEGLKKRGIGPNNPGYQEIQKRMEDARYANLEFKQAKDKINAIDLNALGQSVLGGFSASEAQNINRGGLSNQLQRAQLNALARLGGGTQEFTNPLDSYQAYKSGTLGFNMDQFNRFGAGDIAAHYNRGAQRGYGDGL